jgi:uncharacterized protein (DUF1501 family)
MALERDSLLPLSSGAFGFNPKMTRMQQLFNSNKLAVIANVGPLVEPIPADQISSAETFSDLTAPIPNQLFSHNSQRDLWMQVNARTAESKGWAAKTADILALGNLINITVGGSNLMQRGGIFKPLAVADDIYAFDDFYRVRMPDTSVGQAYRQLMQANKNHLNKLLGNFAKTRQDEINLQERLDGILPPRRVAFSNGVHEVGRTLGSQLEMVTRLLDARTSDFFPDRQIFFVNYHGWDTHDTPVAGSGPNSHKVEYLDESLGTFYQVLEDMGIQEQVTTFTIADFGRSITSNGNGTDHGWGGHAFVLGGAVNGGFYGEMPRIERNSADAIAGRVVPTTSVEQYLATLVSWLGVNDADLDTVFGNLHSFNSRGLGFMV